MCQTEILIWFLEVYPSVIEGSRGGIVAEEGFPSCDFCASGKTVGNKKKDQPKLPRE